MTDRKEDGLQALGAKTEYRMDYAPEVKETFDNKHPDNQNRVPIPSPRITTHNPLPYHRPA